MQVQGQFAPVASRHEFRCIFIFRWFLKIFLCHFILVFGSLFIYCYLQQILSSIYWNLTLLFLLRRLYFALQVWVWKNVNEIYCVLLHGDCPLLLPPFSFPYAQGFNTIADAFLVTRDNIVFCLISPLVASLVWMLSCSVYLIFSRLFVHFN